MTAPGANQSTRLPPPANRRASWVPRGGSQATRRWDEAERGGMPRARRLEPRQPRGARVQGRAEKRRRTGKHSPARPPEGHCTRRGDISAQSVRRRHAPDQPPPPPVSKGPISGREVGGTGGPAPRAAGARDLRAPLSRRAGGARASAAGRPAPSASTPPFRPERLVWFAAQVPPPPLLGPSAEAAAPPPRPGGRGVESASPPGRSPAVLGARSGVASPSAKSRSRPEISSRCGFRRGAVT